MSGQATRPARPTSGPYALKMGSEPMGPPHTVKYSSATSAGTPSVRRLRGEGGDSAAGPVAGAAAAPLPLALALPGGTGDGGMVVHAQIAPLAPPFDAVPLRAPDGTLPECDVERSRTIVFGGWLALFRLVWLAWGV